MGVFTGEGGGSQFFFSKFLCKCVKVNHNIALLTKYSFLYMLAVSNSTLLLVELFFFLF